MRDGVPSCGTIEAGPRAGPRVGSRRARAASTSAGDRGRRRRMRRSVPRPSSRLRPPRPVTCRIVMPRRRASSVVSVKVRSAEAIMSREKRAEMCARSMRCRARSPHAPPRRAVKSSQRTTGLRAPKARRVVGRERTVAVMGASFREGSARLPDASEARCLFGSLALAVRVRVRPDRSATGPVGPVCNRTGRTRSATGLAGSVPPTRGRASRANPGRISPARSGSIWFGELGAGRMVPGGAAPDWGSRAGIVRLASGSVMRDSSRQSDFRRLLLSNRDMMVRRGHHTAGPRGARDAPAGTARDRARCEGAIARRPTADPRPTSAPRGQSRPVSESVAKAPIEPERRKRNVDIPRFFSRPIPPWSAFATDSDRSSP